jgi:hypothetical protein
MKMQQALMLRAHAVLIVWAITTTIRSTPENLQGEGMARCRVSVAVTVARPNANSKCSRGCIALV